MKLADLTAIAEKDLFETWEKHGEFRSKIVVTTKDALLVHFDYSSIDHQKGDELNKVRDVIKMVIRLTRAAGTFSSVLFVGEAWVVTKSTSDDLTHVSVSKDPDREEMIFYRAYAEDGEAMKAWIINRETRKLEPFSIFHSGATEMSSWIDKAFEPLPEIHERERAAANSILHDMFPPNRHEAN